ncbi:zinc finger and BTB domain-containing protein 9, partial [Numida meleagris]|uniref:zinc finger and BTB domain-containing protein 9 n=1 Tax=Numida meleagris TaxID=8996 RepID=UPI000B3DA209
MASEGGRVQISFPQHAAALLDSLNRLRLEGKFCDVAVHVGGRVFPAHKSVLAAASPFFHDKLLLQDGGRLLLPPAIDPDAFEGLLHLIYSGRLTLLLEALPGHLLVASGLQMWHVVDQCSAVLRELEAGGGGPCRWVSPGGGTRGGGGDGTAASASVGRGGDGDGATPSPLGGCGGGGGDASASPWRGADGAFPKGGGEEVLKICVEDEEEEEEEEEEEDEEEDEEPGAARRRGGERALQLVLDEEEEEDGGGAAPGDGPKVLYVKQENAEPAGTTTATNLAAMDGHGGFVPAELSSYAAPQAAWKPVDLHGNEILAQGAHGRALHAPVKLCAAPDGKRFGCLCGKRFAVKPKRDRHIMLTFSLRPFACSAWTWLWGSGGVPDVPFVHEDGGAQRLQLGHQGTQCHSAAGSGLGGTGGDRGTGHASPPHVPVPLCPLVLCRCVRSCHQPPQDTQPLPGPAQAVAERGHGPGGRRHLLLAPCHHRGQPGGCMGQSPQRL